MFAVASDGWLSNEPIELHRTLGDDWEGWRGTDVGSDSRSTIAVRCVTGTTSVFVNECATPRWYKDGG